MRSDATIAVIIPAANEEAAIGKVVSAIPTWVDDVVVVDNGSTDRTAAVARAHGARVVREPQRGYGAACLAGIAALRSPDIVVFLDGDFSDHPDEMPRLVDPILRGDADMVIGSRVLGQREPGALTPQARFGNWLSCRLIRAIWRVRYTDLGPFRAISYAALRRLGMADRDYGWTVEMQVKAARAGLRACEVPVRYRKRIGTSKISGTVRGVVGAGTKILYTIFREATRTPARGRATIRAQRRTLEVSVVIPTCNEAGALPATLAALRGEPNLEIIVADGESDDETAAVARAHDARVVTSPRGRAVQMNTGAAAATGDVLLFLHADTRLTAGGIDAIRRALRDTETVGGAFRARLDSPRVAFRLIAAVIDLRTRILRRPYGDQAVFVRADVFRTLGGFPCVPIMEDVELVRRLRHRGRLVVLPEEAITSARRWTANGVLRTTAANWLCASLFAAGVPAETLRRLYDRVSCAGKTNSRSGKPCSRRSRNTGVASAPSPVEVAHE